MTPLDDALLRIDETLVNAAVAAYNTGDPLAARVALRDILVRIERLPLHTSALLEHFAKYIHDDESKV